MTRKNLRVPFFLYRGCFPHIQRRPWYTWRHTQILHQNPFSGNFTTTMIILSDSGSWITNYFLYVLNEKQQIFKFSQTINITICSLINESTMKTATKTWFAKAAVMLTYRIRLACNNTSNTDHTTSFSVILLIFDFVSLWCLH